MHVTLIDFNTHVYDAWVAAENVNDAVTWTRDQIIKGEPVICDRVVDVGVLGQSRTSLWVIFHGPVTITCRPDQPKDK